MEQEEESCKKEGGNEKRKETGGTDEMRTWVLYREAISYHDKKEN